MQRSTNAAQFDFLEGDAPPITVPLEGPVPARPRTAQRLVEAPLTGTASCSVTVEQDSGTVWVRMTAASSPKFTQSLLADLRGVQERIRTRLKAEAERPEAGRLRYQVFASAIPGVFSLGGDLALFRDCIRRGDAHTLRSYARDAVDLVHANATAHDSHVTTISLVQGQALGGGFEAALAAHVLVAERSSRMGLPEILFNMFPGMGAYQLLSRRLTPAQAEQMILGGRTYTAEELHALGVVDVLAEDGEGEQAVRRYIRTHDRQLHGHLGFRRACEAAAPLDRDELYRVADVWVETALGLGERDLATIDYLLRAQERMVARAALEEVPPELLKEA